MTDQSGTTVKRSIGFLLGMSMLMLGANLVWTAYNSLLLPTLVEGAVTNGKGLVTGLIGFFGTLLAVIVSILAGILSDHSASRWGRRTPAILIGAFLGLPLIGLPTLFLAPALRPAFLSLALPIIILSYCGMQFATNVGNGAWWPLLVDVVPEHQRGTTSGIQGALTLVGATVAIVVVTILIQNNQTMAALWLVAGVFALSGVVNALVIKGKDKPAEKSDKISLMQAVRDMFRVRTRVVVFFWLVLAVLLAYLGMNSLQFFALYFFQVYFPKVNPDAAFRTMGGISLVMTMLAAVGSGVLSDKVGRRPLILWAMFLCAGITLLMGLTGNYVVFLILAGLRAAATGPIMASVPALASDLAPKDEAGQYMAYNNLSTGVSGALAGLIFGVILVTLNRTTFMALFITSAIMFLLGGVVFAVKVPQKEIDARLQEAKGSQ
ncbi:MAG: MFS transporter [Anaerolineales bacterium]